MHTILKRVAWFLVAGLAVHGALVACQSVAQSMGYDGGPDAKAAPSDCAQWEAANLDPTGSMTYLTTVPVGWEPVGSAGSMPGFIIRRCKP